MRLAPVCYHSHSCFYLALHWPCPTIILSLAAFCSNQSLGWWGCRDSVLFGLVPTASPTEPGTLQVLTNVSVKIDICIIYNLFFCHSVVSNFLWPHGLQHTRLPCPSPFPRVSSNSYPLSWWFCLTILSSVISFSSCLQSFQASGSFPISWVFASGGQSIGASASTFILPMNIQDSFPLGLTSLISLQSKDSQESSLTPQFKSISSSAPSFLYGPTLTSILDY